MTTEERLEKVEQELAAAKRRNRWMLGGGALLIMGCLTIAATVQVESDAMTHAKEMRAILDMQSLPPAQRKLAEQDQNRALTILTQQRQELWDEQARAFNATRNQQKLDLGQAEIARIKARTALIAQGIPQDRPSGYSGTITVITIETEMGMKWGTYIEKKYKTDLSYDNGVLESVWQTP